MLCEDVTAECIGSIEIVDDGLRDSAALTQRDRDIALRDLCQGNVFQPVSGVCGPYHVVLSIEDGRLVFRIDNAKGEALPMLILSLKPYKRLISDYFMIVNSYGEALKDGKPSRIEAIDMGRRGLHNEGAEMLLDRLSDKIRMDMDTARRLFTLICVLHEGKALQFR